MTTTLMTRPWKNRLLRLNSNVFFFVAIFSLLALNTHALRSSIAAAPNEETVGQWVYNRALDIFNKSNLVHYEHQGGDEASEQVVFKGDYCEALCDCSGFVSYVLHAVTPMHYKSIKQFSTRTGHPLAKTYTRFFQSLSATEPKEGWIRIESYRDLRQGDLIAWEKAVNAPAGVKKKGNTGHVMIVESPASRARVLHRRGEAIRFVSIPVIDSSTVDHFPPEELPPLAHQNHRDGVGRGLIRLILDDNDRIIGYWEGTYWGEGGKNITKPSYTDSVSFARLTSNLHPDS
jgi:hypothetical protein